KNGFVSEFLRKAARKRFPRRTAVASAVDAKPAVAGAAKFVGLDGNDVRAIGIPRVDNDGKAKIRRDAVGDIFPILTVIVGAVESPVILQVETLGASRVHGNFVNALSEFGIFVGHEHGADAAVLRGPGLAAVCGAVNAAGGNGDVHALIVGRVENDGMQGETAVAGNPARAVRMIEEAANQRPGFPSIARFEKRGRFDATIEDVWFLGEAGCDLPDIFQRNAGVGRKADGSVLWIGPAFSEVVAEAKERTPIAVGGSPNAAAALAIIVG